MDTLLKIGVYLRFVNESVVFLLQSDRFRYRLPMRQGTIERRSGQGIGCYGSDRDITDLIRSAAALRVNENLFRLMFRNSPMPCPSTKRIVSSTLIKPS